MDLEIKLDKFDVEVLYCLFVNKKRSPIESFQISEIISNTELNSSYYTFRRRINDKLLKQDLISEGFNVGKSKTYYLNNKGFEFLKENILDKEYNVEEIVVDRDEYEGGNY